MFGNVRFALCVVLVFWSSTAQSAEGSYDDVITKLDNLLYRVVMSEVNIKERIEETEGQLKKTLEQLDSLLEHQNGMVQNDDLLLAKMNEQYEKMMENQENIRGEFSSMLAGMGEDVSSIHQRLEDVMKNQGDLAADHKTLASTLIEVEQNVNQKFVMGMADISERFNKTEERFEEIMQNQENNHVELFSKMSSIKHDLSLVTSNVIEGFEGTDRRFDQLMQNQADLAAGHELLESAVAKLEQHVSEQFTVTLTAMTDHFDKTNDQIDDLAKNQDITRVELSSILTDMKQDLNHNFNVVMSNVSEGFEAVDKRIDQLMQHHANLITGQEVLTSAMTGLEAHVSEQFTTMLTNVANYFDRTNELIEDLAKNQDITREELSSKLSTINQDLNRNFIELVSDIVEGFENADKRVDHLMQHHADLATGHEVLTSALAGLELHVSEQFIMTLTNVTDHFGRTNEQIEDLAKNQDITREELSSKLTSVRQELIDNIHLVLYRIVDGFKTADERIDRLMQHHADLATGHEVLTSTLTGFELHVSEQFTMTLTNVTDHFERTNDQIEDLAKNQDNSRVEITSKLTTLKQDMNNNFNAVKSNVNEGFSKTDVQFDRIALKQDDLAASQQTFSIALSKMNNDVSEKLVKVSANINERSDRLEDQHRTTKDQLDRLLQNLDSHRVEFTTILTRIEQSTNQNFVTVTNYAVQILQQQSSCSTPQQPPVVTSCKNTPTKTSGQYQLKPFGTDEVLVGYCEQEKFGGGWLVMQHRFDGSVDFHRNWNDYKNGFGSIGGEFWLGLDKIHRLTSNKHVELIVELKDFNNNYVYARYDAFEIGSEPQKYSLDKLGTYSGTAGDSMIYNRGKKFTTKDNDNDGAVNLNCAVSRAGAWWFDWCGNADLNGIYGVRGDWRSVYWYGYNQYDGMKYTRMMIREV